MLTLVKLVRHLGYIRRVTGNVQKGQVVVSSSVMCDCEAVFASSEKVFLLGKDISTSTMLAHSRNEILDFHNDRNSESPPAYADKPAGQLNSRLNGLCQTLNCPFTRTTHAPDAGRVL